jgi:hypothetical protein
MKAIQMNLKKFKIEAYLYRSKSIFQKCIVMNKFSSEEK